MKKVFLPALILLLVTPVAKAQILYCEDLDKEEFLIISNAQAFIWNFARWQRKFVGTCHNEEGRPEKYIMRKDLWEHSN